MDTKNLSVCLAPTFFGDKTSVTPSDFSSLINWIFISLFFFFSSAVRTLIALAFPHRYSLGPMVLAFLTFPPLFSDLQFSLIFQSPKFMTKWRSKPAWARSCSWWLKAKTPTQTLARWTRLVFVLSFFKSLSRLINEISQLGCGSGDPSQEIEAQVDIFEEGQTLLKLIPWFLDFGLVFFFSFNRFSSFF